MDFLNFAPAILIFLLTAILAYRNLRLAFWLMVMFSPLVHKELFSLGGVWDLLPIRVAFVGAIVGSLINLFTWIKNDIENAKIVVEKFVLDDPFLILMIVLWLVRLLWIKKSASFDDSFKLFAFYSLIIAIYVVFKSLYVKYGKGFLYRTIYVYLSAGIFTALIAGLQYYLRLCCRWSVGGVWVVPRYLPRLGSTFWDVNHFGGFLITIIPVFLTLLFVSKSIKYKFINLFGAISLSTALFFTQSRSSWLGLGIGLGVMLIMYLLLKLKKPLAFFGVFGVLGIIGMTAILSFSGISLKDKIATYMHYRLDSTDTHVLLLDGAAEIFVNNIALGAGYGNFDHAFRGTQISDIYFNREPRLKESKVPPHSVWGEVLAETGAVGITLYSTLMALIVASLITTVFKSSDLNVKYMGIGFLGGAVSILSAGLFYSYNMEFYWIYLFICIAFVIISANKSWNLVNTLKWWYKSPIAPYLIIVPPSIFYIFLRVGSTTLIDWDEAIYAKVAKNIVVSGEWLSLRWNNMKEYWFEKPPLYMWLTAMIFKITGFTSFGARIVSSIFGFLGIILTYKFGSKLFNKLTGIFASLILLSTVHYLYYSRNGMLDVTVTFFILLTTYFFYKGVENFENKKLVNKQFAIAGVSLGFAVMTKGIVGLIPLPIISLYSVYLYFNLQKLQRKLFLKNLIKAISFLVGFFFIIAGPWHIYSLIIHGEKFWDKYFIDHMLGRGLSGFGHEKSFTWFFEVIKVSFRIWIFPLFGGLLLLPFIDKQKKQLALLLISILFVLIFFSISKDKLLWYIMPIYPFIAIISARFMERILTFVSIRVKNEIGFESFNLRLIGIFSIFVISIFYVVIMRDRIYYPDFNKDKVALVRINNELYPVEDYSDRKLYYNGIEPPVLLFYSDHEINGIDQKNILKMINEAKADENFSFLVPEKIYYKTNSQQDLISAPLVLDIKGASGGWILFKSKSRVELLMEELKNLELQIKPLFEKTFLVELTDEESLQLEKLSTARGEVIDKLTQLGFPPYIGEKIEVKTVVE